MDYKSAGVDTEKARSLLSDLKGTITATHGENPAGRPIGTFGGFAGAFRPGVFFSGADVVAATDGVGTKIQLIRKFNRHHTVGFDLVAMCVNDLYCAGATPAFFLDYIACGRLDDSWYKPVIDSISRACTLVPMALLGGETAEHPGVMPDDEYDLAGFCVGFVKPDGHLPRLNEVKGGDVLVALPSSGVHSNGFSLVRKILARLEQENPQRYLKLLHDEQFIDKLLAPTRIYSFMPALLAAAPIKAAVHITGGGFYENIPRVLPAHTAAVIQKPRPFQLPVFDFLAEFVAPRELYKTYNMGIGMVLVCTADVLPVVQKFDERACIIGEIQGDSEAGYEAAVRIKGIDFS